MLERQPPHVGSERCHGDFIVKKKCVVVPKNSLIEKREERRSMGVMESPVFIAIAYELNNCPRAILVYRPPQMYSTNSLLSPVDAAMGSSSKCQNLELISTDINAGPQWS